MPRIAKALAVVIGFGAATPALAQYRPYPPPRYYPEYPSNALRLEIGGATLSSPGICTRGAAMSGSCVDSSPFAWQALALSGDLDLGLGGPLNLTLGAHELAAPYYSGNPSIFEPVVGLTFKFGRHTPVQPRLAIGGGLLLGNDGNSGGALRLGAGISFFGAAPIGFALDLVLSIGSFAGYEVSQVELAIGPEFRF